MLWSRSLRGNAAGYLLECACTAGVTLSEVVNRTLAGNLGAHAAAHEAHAWWDRSKYVQFMLIKVTDLPLESCMNEACGNFLRHSEPHLR